MRREGHCDVQKRTRGGGGWGSEKEKKDTGVLRGAIGSVERCSWECCEVQLGVLRGAIGSVERCNWEC